MYKHRLLAIGSIYTYVYVHICYIISRGSVFEMKKEGIKVVSAVWYMHGKKF